MLGDFSSFGFHKKRFVTQEVPLLLGRPHPSSWTLSGSLGLDGLDGHHSRLLRPLNRFGLFAQGERL